MLRNIGYVIHTCVMRAIHYYITSDVTSQLGNSEEVWSHAGRGERLQSLCLGRHQYYNNTRALFTHCLCSYKVLTMMMSQS